MLKKKFIQTLALLTSIACLTGCTQGTAQSTSSPDSTVPITVKGDIELDTSNLLATNIDLVDTISLSHPDSNVMISGMSLNYALAMLANGASLDALTAIEDYLGMDLETANSFYSEFLTRKGSPSQNKLVISNSFWTDDSLPYDIHKNYINILENTYQAEVAQIPMNDKGVKEVNNWVDKATDGLIQKALSPSDLTPETVSILINAILFDGKWETPFYVEDTREEEFTLVDGTKTVVEGMHSEEYFYYENEFATGFRKDYDEKEYYMIAILPKEEGDFSLAELAIEDLIASGKSTAQLNAELHIMLPKTDFETKYNLSNMLKQTSLEQLFDQGANNLPLIYDNDAPGFCSYASSIIQNDRLIIDESGTKAAAVTSVIVDNCIESIEQKDYLQVYLNRPFAILLMDGATDEPLFVAKIMNP
ncbi:MAG: hypothetical protein IJF07_05100 [Lachnospiraceae bacterium]|nr:hypothetical protein [Lachnospiraceae bacterium]